MLNYVILYSLAEIDSVFCVCDNRGKSEFQFTNKVIDEIACLFCICDNMSESGFQYRNNYRINCLCFVYVIAYDEFKFQYHNAFITYI